MGNLHFSSVAVIGLVAEGALMIALPVVLLIIWKKKTHEKLLVPVAVGAVTWLLFAIVLKLAPAYFLLQADTPAAKAIAGNPWLSYLVAGALAGVFEETGRYLAFRFALKKYTHRRASVSYGLGHGGFESAYIGFQIISVAMLGALIGAGLGEKILSSGTDEETLALIVTQLAPYANATLGECMLGVFERCVAIAMHLSLSVLVFAAVREKKFRLLYPAAVLLHAAFDFSIVLGTVFPIPAWGLELILAALVVPIALLARHVYRKLKADEEPEADEISVG
ncbi:MAG: YhfC family intramembrane metalloprotease [Clostridia bacterium]|nr:YhfC family intramembrane metalloprotease [Clostridia bacterium]